MNQPPESSPPITRSEHAIRDIFAVVEHIREMLRVQQVAALGWATGAQWLAHYAATCNHAISHLILFNALWPMAGDWPIGDALEDPEQPGQLKPGALACYGYASAESLLARWNDSIPAQEHDSWRDPAVSAAYARSAISSDPSSIERDPPSIRTPLGAMADSFLLSKGHRLFEPKQITARVLVFRSGLDFWSRPMDLRVAERELTNATNVECIELPDATHFAHLDRPERGRAALIDAILRSMRGQSAG